MSTARERLDARRRQHSVTLVLRLLIVFAVMTAATWIASWLATPRSTQAELGCPEPPTKTPHVIIETVMPVPPTATDAPPTATSIPPTVTSIPPTATAKPTREPKDPTATPFLGWPTRTPGGPTATATATATATPEVCDLCLEVRGIRLALEKFLDILD